MKLSTRSSRTHYTLAQKLIVVFLLLLSVIMMYPMVWMVLTSFRTNADIRLHPAQFWPTEWSLEGYEMVFTRVPLGHWFINSMIVTLLVTGAVILTSTFMGFVFAKYEFKAKKPLFYLLIATMMVPAQVTMIPRYLIIQQIHLFNTIWALIVPSLVSAFSVYLARQFIADIPNSLCEAALLDGAGPVSIYWHVILPNIKPAIGSIGIFTAMAHWNDYLNPLLMLNDINRMTLPLGLVYFDSQRGINLAAIMAAATLIMVPMVIIFLLFQKQFIRGMTLSGVK
ncbi:MAG: carbohydrate ABC transporter permease [Atopobiaceae bacterium]|jgi:multiple sugar transport system permease protein